MILGLDASVAIKFHAREPESSQASAWVGFDTRFAVPDIFLVQVMQALLRHSREGLISHDQLVGAARELTSLVEMSLPSADLMRSALSLAHTLRHGLHDCMYLALAERLRCPLLTADERLARNATTAKLSIPVLLHTEAPR